MPADNASSTSARQGAALTCFVALRAREAPTEPQLLPASSAVADSFFANSGSRIGATAGAAAGGGLVPAPVELSSATGPSPTRWPKPQHGKGALELGLCLAAALSGQGQGAALTCFVALRAREAPTAPQLLPASSAVADSFFANSGSRIGATAGAAAGAAWCRRRSS